jgi:hypothetical protein
LENKKVARIFGFIFSMVKVLHWRWREMAWAIFWAIFSQSGYPGANPTIVSYNASIVNFYNATGSIARLENKIFLFYFEKRSSLLQRWSCSCKLKSRKIGSWLKRDRLSGPIQQKNLQVRMSLRIRSRIGSNRGMYLRGQQFTANWNPARCAPARLSPFVQGCQICSVQLTKMVNIPNGHKIETLSFCPGLPDFLVQLTKIVKYTKWPQNSDFLLLSGVARCFWCNAPKC